MTRIIHPPFDGARLTEERTRVARGPDAPALASIAAVLAFALAVGLLALATGGGA